ncbi:MAG: undecaprenyl-diphosphate phosphatase [Candidatus Atribacteria bacterium]|nr:undecaprenyl-diphosphate phosphatase [Candidatus Atribacteria bacterium]MBE3092653.1 undecaprenyl-diphosphate phosphatase [Chloroflexota bacterium]MBE3126882.1 undecaprenyl-diphosphate phosphatase [Candidatus Atribacteria bacterium]
MSLILLGIMQGLTEFFPVSSSGHLVIAKYFLQLHLPGAAFEAFLHFGTVLAVILLFRKEIKELVISFFDSIYKLFQGENILNIFKNNLSSKLAWFLVISTMPAAIIGYTFSSYFEILFGKPIIASFMLTITGALLWLGNKYYTGGNKNISEITYKDAIFIGVAQAVAIFPGISRSGLTVIAGLSRNLDREFAARYSFILSVPIILGASIFKMRELSSLNIDLSILILSGLLAAISSYGAMKIFIRLLKNRKIYFFSYYLWIISGLTIWIYLSRGL